MLLIKVIISHDLDDFLGIPTNLLQILVPPASLYYSWAISGLEQPGDGSIEYHIIFVQ
jgi:hypothetical protein